MEYVIISINQLESRGRTSIKKDYQSIYYCCPKQQRLCSLFVQTRTRKNKKSVPCVYTNEHGLKKLKCSCVQILRVAHHITALSGDVEENPGPFTQISNDKNAPCAKQVNSDSLLKSILSELGRIPVNALGDLNCFFHVVSCQLYNTPEYHLHICFLGVKLVLHHPELYIESNYEYSWQNYVNNMAGNMDRSYYNSSCCKFSEYYHQYHVSQL